MAAVKEKEGDVLKTFVDGSNRQFSIEMHPDKKGKLIPFLCRLNGAVKDIVRPATNHELTKQYAFQS